LLINTYMADLRPDLLTTYQSEQKLVVSRRPGVLQEDEMLQSTVSFISEDNLCKSLQLSGLDSREYGHWDPLR
jgi:hypothetical protein